ncbi:MAG TPA: PKD domain-containing protein [Candidatus Manganitrophaceae bacterium]|nr:PKD domain-containing protein [Candidatus Manganitrophaceae bacterium]
MKSAFPAHCVALLLSLFLSACGGSTTPSPPGQQNPQPTVSAVKLSPQSVTVPVGKEEPVAVTVLDASGQPIPGATPTYTVADPTVAAVTPAGIVKGLQEGTTLLTASYENVESNSVLVQILPVVATIELSSRAATISIHASVSFVATAKDAKGIKIADAQFTWHSSDPTVASIDEQGTATGLQKGVTEITAEIDGVVSAPATLTVNEQAVANTPPTARFTPTPPAGNAPLNVQFDGSGSSDSDGAIASYSWNFGDGVFGNGKVVSHLYRQPGSFTVTLTVIDDKGATGTAAVTMTIKPEVIGKGWQKQAVDGDLFGISFVSASEGWTVGLDQKIFHTADGGKSWSRQSQFVWSGSAPPAEVPVDLYDIFFVNATTGWAVGWPEAIFKTTDGGATWVEQHLNRENWTSAALADGSWCEVWDRDPNTGARTTCSKKHGVYLRKVKFLNSQHGWTVGRFGYVFRTDDGGATWEPISQNYPRPLPYPCVYPSTDPNAGQPRPAVTDYNPHLFALDIIAKDDVWVGGGSEGDEPCDKGWLRAIMHTKDGGQSWDYFYEAEADPSGGDPRAQLGGNGRIFDLKFINDAAWAVGGNGTSRPNALYSSDGGKTWHQHPVASDKALGAAYYGLSFFSPSQIWMAGWGGLIMHSDDGGATWSRQSAGTSAQLRRTFFIDEKTGWIASQGEVILTATGGK